MGNSQKLLPDTLAVKKAHERAWRILEANRYVLLLHESAFSLPAAQRLEGLRDARGIIQRGEAVHAPTHCHKVGVIRRARLRLGSVGFRYRAAQHDARLEVDACEHLVEDGAADIVEEDVDPIGAQRRKPSADVLAFVVDSRVAMRL